MRILIVEDEVTLAKRLKRLCADILGDQLTTLKAIDNLDDADDYVNEHPIDLLLLDLNLKNRDGFQLMKQSVAGAFHTIVVSANVHRAIEAFEYGVLDFVPKPFSRERLQDALERYTRHGRPEREQGCSARYLSIKKGSDLEVVPVASIAYIRGASNYSELLLKDGSSRLHSKSLSKLLNVLPGDFERVHKSFLVSMAEARKLVALPGPSYHLILKSGAEVPVSRSKAKAFRHLM